MLRTCISQYTQFINSLRSTSSTSAVHTSAILWAETHRKRQARIARKTNIERRAERQRLAEATRPHVVLGTRPGDDAKWQTCDLAKVLITREKLDSAPSPPPVTSAESLHLPPLFNFGVTEREKELLFHKLPDLTAENRVLKTQGWGQYVDLTSSWGKKLGDDVAKIELRKANQLARVTDLRNANARGIAYENRRLCIEEFSEPGQAYDTGRPEVQAALMTMKIRNLWDHLTKNRKDVGNRRSLRKLVHQRAKMLKYLKGLDRDRYDRVLERLALEPQSVEGELVV